MKADEFAQRVLRECNADEEFSPFAAYDRDGDCIEFIADPDSYYAERVDGIVTVYYSEQSNAIIGAQIKGVSKLMKQYPGLMIEIHDGSVQLHLLLRARLWEQDSRTADIAVMQYKKLIDLAEQSNARVRLDDLATAI